MILPAAGSWILIRGRRKHGQGGGTNERMNRGDERTHEQGGGDKRTHEHSLLKDVKGHYVHTEVPIEVVPTQKLFL